MIGFLIRNVKIKKAILFIDVSVKALLYANILANILANIS